MKKFFLILTGLAMVFIVSCSSDPEVRVEATKTLQEMIDETESKGTLDVSAVSDKALSGKSYTISKPITIANASLQDATFVVKASSVTFEKSTVGTVFVLAENASISADADTTIATVYCKKSTTFQGEGKITNTIYLDGSESSEQPPISVIPDGNADPLQKMIDDTESGEMLDLAKLESDVATDKSYTILKPVTIANCSRLQNATFVVHADSVSFSNATVGKVILAKENITISAPNGTTIEKLYCLYGKDAATIKDEAAYGEIIDTTKDTSLPPDDKKAVLDSYAQFYEALGFKIEGFEYENGKYCTKITNENAKLNSPENNMTMIWSDVVYWHEKLAVEKGRNYEISIDLKSDKDCIIRLETGDFENYPGSKLSKYYALKANVWQTCKLQTGTAPEDWVLGQLVLDVGFAETLYAKDFKIVEVENKALGINCYYNSYDDYAKITCESNDDKSLTLTVAGDIQSDSGIDIILPWIFEENYLYKISFDVEGKVDNFRASVEPASNYYPNYYGGKLTGSTPIELYMSSHKDGQNQTYIPAKLWISPTASGTLQISNLKMSKTSMTLKIGDETKDVTFDGNRYRCRFEKVLSDSSPVISSIIFDGKTYVVDADDELLWGKTVDFALETTSGNGGKAALKVLDGFEGSYDFDLCVDYVPKTNDTYALQVSFDNVTLYDKKNEEIHTPLFIAGTMNDWSFELLDYTKDAESVVGVSDPYGYGMWYYEFIEDYDCVESTPLMKPLSVEFKVCTTPGWASTEQEKNEIFKSAEVNDYVFSYSDSNMEGNARITCPISVGDKLCFCYDGKRYLSKVIKASAGENAGTGGEGVENASFGDSE